MICKQLTFQSIFSTENACTSWVAKVWAKNISIMIAELDSSLIPCHHLYTIRCWIKSSFMKSVDMCCCMLSTQEKKENSFAHIAPHQSSCIIVIYITAFMHRCIKAYASSFLSSCHKMYSVSTKFHPSNTKLTV